MVYLVRIHCTFQRFKCFILVPTILIITSASRASSPDPHWGIALEHQSDHWTPPWLSGASRSHCAIVSFAGFSQPQTRILVCRLPMLEDQKALVNFVHFGNQNNFEELLFHKLFHSYFLKKLIWFYSSFLFEEQQSWHWRTQLPTMASIVNAKIMLIPGNLFFERCSTLLFL